MPNRIVREGILTSERVNMLDWETEVFYRRLLSVVDDFGRYTAHASLLRAALYPLKLEIVREATMERLISECEKARLVVSYEIESKRYLQVLDFNQQVRAKDSKYPPPPDKCTADAKHVHSIRPASAHLDVSVVGDDKTQGDSLTLTPCVTEVFAGGKSLTPKKPLPSQTESIPPTSACWAAYSSAYLERHGCEPTANAKVRGQLAQFVARVPREEAPAIAAFYVRSNKAIYVRDKHPIGWLLAHAETLRTEWVTGRQGTESEARQADQTQGRGNVFTELIQEAKDAERNVA